MELAEGAGFEPAHPFGHTGFQIPRGSRLLNPSNSPLLYDSAQPQ